MPDLLSYCFDRNLLLGFSELVDVFSIDQIVHDEETLSDSVRVVIKLKRR